MHATTTPVTPAKSRCSIHEAGPFKPTCSPAAHQGQDSVQGPRVKMHTLWSLPISRSQRRTSQGGTGPPAPHWETALGGEGEPLPLALQTPLFKEGLVLLSGTTICYHFQGRNSTLGATPGWD